MTVLSPELRKELWAGFMREQSEARQPTPLTKYELLDTIGSVDEQLDGFLEILKSNISIKAQAALTEADWLRLLELSIRGRHMQEVKGGGGKDQVAEEAVK